MKKDLYMLLGMFGIGILFRLLLTLWYPQPLLFDQAEYHRFAVHILTKGVYAESARLYGYPIILAFLYKLFGLGNVQAVYVFQAIVDSLTALLLYAWAKLLFKQKSIPWIACVLYMFNPYTSAYVGTVLSEVTGIFITTILLITWTLLVIKKKVSVFLLFSITAGFLPQIRPAFLYFSIGLFLISIWKYRKHLKLMCVGIALYILPFLYVLWGNATYFNEWKFTPVDKIFPRELFISIMVPHRLPDSVRKGYAAFPKDVARLYETYSNLPTNQKERAAMGNAYLTQSIKIIQKNPLVFVRDRFNKLFFVWEKHFLFYYEEAPNTIRGTLIYWGNILLLLFGLSGLVVWLIQKKTVIAAIYVCFIAYISVIHSVSLAEERYSLPGYPLVFLFAGYALLLLHHIISHPQRFVSNWRKSLLNIRLIFGK